MSLILNHHPKQSKAIDLSAKTRFEALNLASITNLALKCDARLLPILANAYDISIDGLSENEARKLLSKALHLQRYAGSAYAIKEGLKAVFESALVKEWFDYEGKPYHFKIKLSNQNKPFDESAFKSLEKLIYELKNVRSVLELIELRVQSLSKKYNVCFYKDVEKLRILPLQIRKRELKNSSSYAFGILLREKIKSKMRLKLV